MRIRSFLPTILVGRNGWPTRRFHGARVYGKTVPSAGARCVIGLTAEQCTDRSVSWQLRPPARGYDPGNPLAYGWAKLWRHVFNMPPPSRPPARRPNAHDEPRSLRKVLPRGPYPVRAAPGSHHSFGTEIAVGYFGPEEGAGSRHRGSG